MQPSDPSSRTHTAAASSDRISDMYVMSAERHHEPIFSFYFLVPILYFWTFLDSQKVQTLPKGRTCQPQDSGWLSAFSSWFTDCYAAHSLCQLLTPFHGNISRFLHIGFFFKNISKFIHFFVTNQERVRFGRYSSIQNHRSSRIGGPANRYYQGPERTLINFG